MSTPHLEREPSALMHKLNNQALVSAREKVREVRSGPESLTMSLLKNYTALVILMSLLK